MDTLTVHGKKVALHAAADLLVDLGLRRDLASNRGMSVGEAICVGLTRTGSHENDNVCRSVMFEVAATLDCGTLHEAMTRFGDMTAEQWAIRLRAVGDGKL